MRLSAIEKHAVDLGILAGVVVYEYELRIGWGKAVALPAQALPAPPPGQMAVRPKEVRREDYILRQLPADRFK